MANGGGRKVWKIAFENFLKSFRPRQIKGNFIGEDYFGNKYYEIPANPAQGKRKTSRWFEPAVSSDIDHGHELTAEWESWLRLRRQEPPTNEELMKNLAIMQMKKKNAALLDEKFEQIQDHAALKRDAATGKADFPRYDEEYETMPGITPIKKK